MTRVALVHDWLVGYAGGEKVLEAIEELYEGPIYTLIHEEEAMKKTPLRRAEVRTSLLQKLPKVGRYYRNLLPLFPAAIEKLDLSPFDLILSSSHAVAKGVKKTSDQMHICYCHTPMRYAWDLSDFHLQALSRPKQLLAKRILPYLRSWDKKSSSRVDHFIANSHCVADRIYRHYGRQAAVIYPPVDTHLFDIAEEKEDYYITCSRLVPYKRIDLLVEAFASLPDKRLLLIGSGPEEERLRHKAGPNVLFLGHTEDETLRTLVARARGFLFAAEEDFGIVTVEAQSAGVPVIAYGKGGSLETVDEGKTGIFFYEQTASSLLKAIEKFEALEGSFDPQKIKAHAEKFSKERFQKEFRDFVETACVATVT